MIINKNLVKGKKKSQKNLIYDVFQNFVNSKLADSRQEIKNVSNLVLLPTGTLVKSVGANKASGLVLKRLANPNLFKSLKYTI